MIPILFENDDIIAIDKPEGVASIPTRTKSEETIVSLLSAQCGLRLFVVHRLDREVSGAMLFAKTAAAHKLLNEQFFDRVVKKIYALVATGVIAEDSGVIDKPLRQFGSGRIGVDEKAGKASVTAYEVADRKEKYTLVNAHPRTGRRHQIRAHFYSIGHPIAGDRRYGDKSKQEEFPRLMLHASQISFTLPSKETVTVVAPLPESMKSVLKGLGWDFEESVLSNPLTP